MIKHNKILVPTDFSEASTESLRRASVLAETFDAELHLLHVVKPSMYFETDMVSAASLGGVNKAIHERELVQLQKQAKACDVEVVLHHKASVGDHARTICEFAKSLPADLIVIGRHDEKHVLHHMFVGATAERVIAHAPCSVLVTVPHDLIEKVMADSQE